MFGKNIFGLIYKMLQKLDIRRDYVPSGNEKINSSSQESTKRLSDLEELGLLAASIEHDIKTPLAIIELEIQKLRNRLQAYPDVLKSLERIGAQKRRIYDLLAIIRIVRADPDFYERFMERINALELIHIAILTVKQEMRINPKAVYLEVLNILCK